MHSQLPKNALPVLLPAVGLLRHFYMDFLIFNFRFPFSPTLWHLSLVQGVVYCLIKACFVLPNIYCHFFGTTSTLSLHQRICSSGSTTGFLCVWVLLAGQDRAERLTGYVCVCVRRCPAVCTCLRCSRGILTRLIRCVLDNLHCWPWKWHGTSFAEHSDTKSAPLCTKLLWKKGERGGYSLSAQLNSIACQLGKSPNWQVGTCSLAGVNRSTCHRIYQCKYLVQQLWSTLTAISEAAYGRDTSKQWPSNRARPIRLLTEAGWPQATSLACP